MTSQLPATPRFVFTVLEPISLYAFFPFSQTLSLLNNSQPCWFHRSNHKPTILYSLSATFSLYSSRRCNLDPPGPAARKRIPAPRSAGPLHLEYHDRIEGCESLSLGTLARRHWTCGPDAVCYGLGRDYGCWELECCYVGKYRRDGCLVPDEIAIFCWSLWGRGTESKGEGEEEITQRQGLVSCSVQKNLPAATPISPGHRYNELRFSSTYKDIGAKVLQIFFTIETQKNMTSNIYVMTRKSNRNPFPRWVKAGQ